MMMGIVKGIFLKTCLRQHGSVKRLATLRGIVEKQNLCQIKPLTATHLVVRAGYGINTARHVLESP